MIHNLTRNLHSQFGTYLFSYLQYTIHRVYIFFKISTLKGGKILIWQENKKKKFRRKTIAKRPRAGFMTGLIDEGIKKFQETLILVFMEVCTLVCQVMKIQAFSLLPHTLRYNFSTSLFKKNKAFKMHKLDTGRNLIYLG